MTNDALTNAVEAYKDATLTVIYELKYLFPVGTEVDVRLLSKQKKWSRATVIGHDTLHGGA